MNAIDVYYINKANEKLEDKYFDSIQQSDIDNINKAKRNILTIPIMTFGVTYVLTMLRSKIFVSSNFLLNILTIRRKYSNTKYKSKSYEERKDSVQEMAEPYKEIKEQKLKFKDNMNEQSKDIVEV